MATRQETQQKRRLMREDILESRDSGRVQEGDLMPPLRALAKQYGLSVDVAGEVIQTMVAEGVLYARPGLGIIVGSPRAAGHETYLFLTPRGCTPEYVASGYIGQVQRSFELTVARQGGACLTLDTEQVELLMANRHLPELAGVFTIDPEPEILNSLAAKNSLAVAYFGQPTSGEAIAGAIAVDRIEFDNVEGGRQATDHLMKSGHSKIAFLGLHTPTEFGAFRFSAERELGWRESMGKAGNSCEELVFYPAQLPRAPEAPEDSRGSVEYREALNTYQERAMRAALTTLPQCIQQRKFTAVVATNLAAARALFSVLQETDIVPELWPAVVCFDNFDGLDNHVISALTLPWEDVGRAGATVLRERTVGRSRNSQEARKVKMQLIQRLTSRADWAENSNFVLPHLERLRRPRSQSGRTGALVA